MVLRISLKNLSVKELESRYTLVWPHHTSLSYNKVTNCLVFSSRQHTMYFTIASTLWVTNCCLRTIVTMRFDSIVYKLCVIFSASFSVTSIVVLSTTNLHNAITLDIQRFKTTLKLSYMSSSSECGRIVPGTWLNLYYTRAMVWLFCQWIDPFS